MKGLICSALFLIVSCRAFAESNIELVKATGSWYSDATLDNSETDACNNVISGAKITYKYYGNTLEDAKKKLFAEKYRGGICQETTQEMADERVKLIPYPSWNNSLSWREFVQSKQVAYPVMTFYQCLLPNNGNDIPYFFHAKFYPDYQCEEGSCNSNKTACQGDVFGGDLLLPHGEFLGHVGIISKGYPEITSVAEVTKEPPIIHPFKLLSAVQSERSVWGVRYGLGNLGKAGEMDQEKAEIMLSEALRQSRFNPRYTTLPKYVAGSREVTAVFRCDTFVQYLYKYTLGAQLPPYYLYHAPKDQYNAFPNQRGQPQLVKAELNSLEGFNDLRHILSSDYPKLETDGKIDYLDVISFYPNSMYYRFIEKELQSEKDREVIDRLLSTLGALLTQPVAISPHAKRIFQKMHKEWLAKGTDWEVNVLLNVSLLFNADDAKILLDRYMRSQYLQLSKEKRNAIRGTVNLAMYRLLLKSPSEKAMTHWFYVEPNTEDIFRVATYINDMSQSNTERHRELLWNTLMDKNSSAFRLSGIDIKDKINMNFLSDALLKTKPDHCSDENVLLNLAIQQQDAYTASLIVNNHYKLVKSSESKQQFLSILEKRKQPLLKPTVSSSESDIQSSISAAIQHLTPQEAARY